MQRIDPQNLSRVNLVTTNLKFIYSYLLTRHIVVVWHTGHLRLQIACRLSLQWALSKHVAVRCRELDTGTLRA